MARKAYVEAIARGDYQTALGIVQKMTEAESKTITYTIHTVTSGGPGFKPGTAKGGTVPRGGGIAGEAGPEFVEYPDGRTGLLLGPAVVPAGTKVTSTRRTAQLLRGRRPPRFAGGTGAQPAVVASRPMTFQYIQNAPVYGVEDLDRYLAAWSRQIGQQISVGRRS